MPHSLSRSTRLSSTPTTISVPKVSARSLIPVLKDTYAFAGKRKLAQLEAEIQHLMKVHHPNLLSVLAVKLSFPHIGPPRLAILSEQRPALTLQDVLEDCDSLREDRASVRRSALLLSMGDSSILPA